MARPRRPSASDLMSLVEQSIRSELGTSIAGSEIELTTQREMTLDAWFVQVKVGRRFHAGVYLTDHYLESMAEPGAYVRSMMNELTRLIKKAIYENNYEGFRTLEDFAFGIFEETGILIGGDW